VGITLHVEGIAESFTGKIAGQQTFSSLACAFLGAAEYAEVISQPHREGAECVQALANVHAELNGLQQCLNVAHGGEYSWIQSRGIALSVARDGRLARLWNLPDHPLASNETLKTWLFGPALILALARHGVYCLHASSIAIKGRAYVLIGRSGAGKSTLARASSRPLTDDVSPLGTAELLAHFPQLKLKSGCYPNLAERYPLGGFIHVTRANPGVESLSAINAPALLRLLLSHTIAARLFHQDELAPHLRWCAALATQFSSRSGVLSLSHNSGAPAIAAQSALEKLGVFARRAG